MIRILQMIGSLNIGGSQAMVMNLYRNIDRNHIQFDFIVDHPSELYYEDEIKSLGGSIFVLPNFRGSNVQEIRKAWSNFFKEHPEYRVLHSHVRSYASIYIPIAKHYGVKTIIHSHSTSNGKGVSSVVKTVMQYPLRYQADYFLGCSQEAGEWLFGKRIVRSKKYFMLQNSIDTSKYVIDENIQNLYREKLGINDKQIVFMHVGRLHEAKNHLFLLDVFDEYLCDYSNAVLVIIGDGELKEIIEDKVKKMHNGPNVLMLGAKNDVANWLRAADCFLFPSKWEGLPVTVIEAQAAGLPCLVSDKVTKDVNISDLVHYLPIDNGVEPWVKAMENIDIKKRDVSDKIKEAGFDIHSSAKWMFDFYMRLSKNE